MTDLVEYRGFAVRKDGGVWRVESAFGPLPSLDAARSYIDGRIADRAYVRRYGIFAAWCRGMYGPDRRRWPPDCLVGAQHQTAYLRARRHRP